MARFEITAPDGRLFEVTAPEGASQAEVLSYAQQNFGQPSTTLGQKAIGVGETALSAGTGIIGQFAGNVAGVGHIAVRKQLYQWCIGYMQGQRWIIVGFNGAGWVRFDCIAGICGQITCRQFQPLQHLLIYGGENVTADQNPE